MWRIDNPKIISATLDLSSSAQGDLKATQVVADGAVLINALELIEWDDEKIQISVCDHCGTVGCSSGNWITMRQSGRLILLMPAFEAMHDDAWSTVEFSPPSWISRQGAAYFEVETYQSLRELTFLLPPLEKIQPLQMREAMWLVQANAPLRILGEPSTLKIDQGQFDFAVATSQGEPQEHLHKAEELLRANFDNHRLANLHDLSNEDEPIWLLLDANELFNWQPLVFRDGKYQFLVDDKFVVTEI